LAAMLYEVRLAGSAAGVIIANLVPALPLVVLLLTPFFEQIDPNLERAARILGASPRRVFTRVLVPLAAPGVLAAALTVVVRTLRSSGSRSSRRGPTARRSSSRRTTRPSRRASVRASRSTAWRWWTWRRAASHCLARSPS